MTKETYKRNKQITTTKQHLIVPQWHNEGVEAETAENSHPEQRESTVAMA